MAMAYWGLALALGSNINHDIDAEGQKEPYEHEFRQLCAGVECDADVNARDADGSTALMLSALGGHKETTDVLLGGGADVNLRDSHGQTALIRAAARGHADIVRELISRGARIDYRDGSGRDALTWAEVNKKSDVVDLLKKAQGARP
jgi:ankyrin repeat protein